jgi:hypothetical protein
MCWHMSGVCGGGGVSKKGDGQRAKGGMCFSLYERVEVKVVLRPHGCLGAPYYGLG